MKKATKEEIKTELMPFLTKMKEEYGDKWTEEKTEKVINTFDGMNIKNVKRILKIIVKADVSKMAKQATGYDGDEDKLKNVG